MTQLRSLKDSELLEVAQRILAEPRDLSIRDRVDLLNINDEFIRRDALRAMQLCSYCHQPHNGGPRCSNCGGL